MQGIFPLKQFKQEGASEMRIFETRHGQILPKSYYHGNASLPVGNSGLSELGKEQARLVGKRLKDLQFNGIIFSSPYDRTLNTAEIIAGEVGAKVVPLLCLREISNVKEPTERNVGNGAEIFARYPHTQVDLGKDFAWREERAENLSDVIERLSIGLEPVLSAVEKGMDVLLVGHAATSVAMRHLFNVEKENRAFHWNCHLSLLYSTNGEKYANDVGHLPEEMRTGNSLNYLENIKKFEEQMQKTRDFLQANSGEKILHISDTHSASYGYYQKLIDEIKPDVIVHTGDLADELKAGRIENARPYWRNTAPIIIRIMENTSARVIIVPGNNDLETELNNLVQRAEILPRNTTLRLYNKKFLLCHELNRMDETAQADIFLYGHGLTGETRTPTDNLREGKAYYNGTWGASLHVPEKNASMIIPKVEI